MDSGKLERRLRQAQDANFTYAEVGATGEDRLPAGYAHDVRSHVIGFGEDAFQRAGAHVVNWGLQRSLGFSIFPHATTVEAGATVLMHRRLLIVPTRVAYVVNEPRRSGFAYGTLPGHPERGEEYFGVAIDQASVVRFELRVFSSPGTWYTKLGSPVARVVQRLATNTYLRSARSASSP
jgi:uncharacterized protein (UPF0548 family)